MTRRSLLYYSVATVFVQRENTGKTVQCHQRLGPRGFLGVAKFVRFTIFRLFSIKITEYKSEPKCLRGIQRSSAGDISVFEDVFIR